ncbi:MAG: magnesium/cobalt transporter CorA [Methanosarcinaceae archaeon]|nr:magnesium/cobalt transporter CorA [Methanosarcinaceae archaeon]MDF1534685.1 magnesium/cobalt transporter CorA [Methanosarcinaceae archaeon]
MTVVRVESTGRLLSTTIFLKNSTQNKGATTISRFTKKVSKQIGLPPGSLVHVGEKRTENVKISIIDYDENQLNEEVVATVEKCFFFKEQPTVTWINIDGIHNTEIIDKIGKHFELHPLILEDIMNTGQRPKLEDFDHYLYIVLKMLQIEEDEDEIKAEQVSLIIGDNFVISFQEVEGDVFDYVRERIRSGKGRIRKLNSDYLAYALMDAIVDGYFMILEKLGDRIELMEDDLLENPTTDTLQDIHSLKREMIFLRKSIWPLREVISRLERGESSLINESTTLYMKDIYDHTIQIIDSIESFRDMLSGMLDIYLSTISNKMNEVMKVLTIISTIFIPITFIAGIYGMNFEYMPELGWRWSYPLLWLVIISVATTMILFFKRRGWL